jgi:acetyl-CoA acetyltransferase
MREVVVLGVAMTKFDRYKDLDAEELAQRAILEALKDSGINKKEIEAAYCGSVFQGPMIGQRSLKGLGMVGIPVYNLENACSSGGTAIREAYLTVKEGRHDVALAFGVEKLSSFGKGGLPLDQQDFEILQGYSMPAGYAMRAQRYLYETEATPEHLAMISVKNHMNGLLNPYAQRHKKVTIEDVLQSRPVADPLTVLQCCMSGDGAAAVIFCEKKKAQQYVNKLIHVTGSVLLSGKFSNGFKDMTYPEITVRAGQELYESTGLDPSDVNVLELHDAFTIAELLYYEALGFCPRGEGFRLIEEGAVEINGRIAVNPSGGLLAKGHPVGATGVAQVVEIVWQLRGEAGNRQVPGARVGMTHCTGGGVWGMDNGACAMHAFTL